MEKCGRWCCSRLPRANHQPGHMLPRDPVQFLKRDLSQISQHGLVSLSCLLSIELCWWTQLVGRTLRTLQCHLLEVFRSNLGSVRGWAMSILDGGTSLAVIVANERLLLFSAKVLFSLSLHLFRVSCPLRTFSLDFVFCPRTSWHLSISLLKNNPGGIK